MLLGERLERYYGVLGAWYAGDGSRLAQLGVPFWRSKEPEKVHVPVAALIASMSASLLFCGSPVVKVGEERLDREVQGFLEEAQVYSVLLQAAEIASVYGAVVLKVNWDRDGVYLVPVSPDCAKVERVNGRVVAVRFVSEVGRGERSGVVYRLCELYTRDGHVVSELFKGTEREMGKVVPLGTLEETAGILPDADSGTGMMLAVYIPNRLPNPAFPNELVGRSDLDGVLGLMSALDETATALMRDVRLGKARIIVPLEYLRRRDEFMQFVGEAASQRWVFDLDEEVFTALDIDPDSSGAGIKIAQGEIRATELLATYDKLLKDIVMCAGFSPQSLGDDGMGQAESGTALSMRERLSLQTVEAKKNHWWHGLLEIMKVIVRMIQVRDGGLGDEVPEITVEFQDNSQPDMQAVADVVSKLSIAGAVSPERKVRMVNPEMSDDQVWEEIEKIEKIEKVGRVREDG